MYTWGTKYDVSPKPLVRYDDSFRLSQAQPVPSHYCYSIHSGETFNSKECYICCALRSDPQSDLLDFNTASVSEMFIVGLYNNSIPLSWVILFFMSLISEPRPRVPSTMPRTKTNTR